MNPVVRALPRSASQPAPLRAAVGLLVSAAAMPLLVHLLPSWDARPLGAHLLPMFWTAFIAVYLFGPKLGVLTGIAGPAASLLVSGAPALEMLGTMTAEVLLFVACVVWATRRWPNVWLIAPAAWVAAKLGVALVLLLLGLRTSHPGTACLHAVVGLLILVALNAALLRVKADQSHE